MKRLFIIIIVVLIIGPFIQYYKVNGSVSADEDFKLAGIEINFSSEKVKTIYGEPLKKKTVINPSPYYRDINLYFTTWFYSDFEVCYIMDYKKDNLTPQELGKVYSVKLTTGKFQTSRGIRIGDPASKVSQTYSTDLDKYIIEPGKYYLKYWVSNNIISFYITNEKVKEIEAHEALFEN